MGHLSKLLEAFKREELFIQGVITVELYAFRIHYTSLSLPSFSSFYNGQTGEKRGKLPSDWQHYSDTTRPII